MMIPTATGWIDRRKLIITRRSPLSTASVLYERASPCEYTTFKNCSSEEDPTRYKDEDATSRRLKTVDHWLVPIGSDEDEDVEALDQ
ncbi:unnamed protein product [Angiostrongylus costaricensis]|uniref:DUF551 domain-containing protein n=1 Tax=Angiostrongylus costaricensis TaxID=334426 RepID=A0A0R3PUV9_ANGCS|nr:unnamed protein product [Angiostrongylus costaricensis]